MAPLSQKLEPPANPVRFRSIDQNTQLQVQTGLTINEMIGVMNGAVGSLQAQNQRRLVDISNTKKALTYGD